MNNKMNFNNNPVQGTIDVKTYLYKVLAYWKLFLVTLFIAFIVAKFLNGYKQKQYSLNTTISVKEVNNPLFSTGTNIAFNWGGASDEIETVRVILKSRSHNEKVVDSLNFFIQYLQEGRYRKNDVYGEIPFTIDLDKSKPQLYNTLIEFEILSKNKLKLSFGFNAVNSTSTIVYKTNTISSYISDEPTFTKEYFINEDIQTPFFNFKILKNKTFIIGQKYFIKFADFNSTVRGYRGVSVNSITQAASMLQLRMQGTNKKRIEVYLNATVDVLERDKKEQKN
jgi:hypothetical protein